MQHLTIALAIIAVALIVSVRPKHAFVVYIAVLMFYPTYLAVRVGTIDIPASRVAATALVLKCLADARLRNKFRWCRLDTWVAVSLTVAVVVTCLTHPLMQALENRSGFLMNTWFAYLAARLCFTDRSSFITVAKWLAVLLIPLALLGVVEAMTGWQPYAELERYCPWVSGRGAANERFGFFRAEGPFGQPICFGMFFAMLLPIVYYLRHEKPDWQIGVYIASGLALLGALSSVSSGPWVMAIAVVLCLVMEKHKHLVKPLLVFAVVSCIFIAIASNRPFYYVIVSYANPLGGAGWHRAKIIDCAVMFFNEWWLVGYGDSDPGWGQYLGMGHTDLTNEFIAAGVRYGILGVITFCCVLTCALRRLVLLHNSATDFALRSLFWALGSTIVALIITFMSVSMFGQIVPLFYCLLGIIGSSPSFLEPNLLRLRPMKTAPVSETSAAHTAKGSTWHNRQTNVAYQSVRPQTWRL
jgi:hypothetical protein